MISGNIIQRQCINKLLDKKTADDKVDVQSIECVSKLFRVVGKKLENEASAIEANKRMFESSFISFKKLASGMPFSFKSRCLQFLFSKGCNYSARAHISLISRSYRASTHSPTCSGAHWECTESALRVHGESSCTLSVLLSALWA